MPDTEGADALTDAQLDRLDLYREPGTRAGLAYLEQCRREMEHAEAMMERNGQVLASLDTSTEGFERPEYIAQKAEQTTAREVERERLQAAVWAAEEALAIARRDLADFDREQEGEG